MAEETVKTAEGQIIPLSLYRIMAANGISIPLATSATMTGVPLAGATGAASSLFPGGVAASGGTVGTGAAVGSSVPWSSITSGIGTGAGIVGAGIGSAQLSNLTQNYLTPKIGETAGAGVAYAANPYGYMINEASKKLGLGDINNAMGTVQNKLGFGAGSTSVNVGNQQAGMNDLYAAANDLKQQALSGKIDQSTYQSNVQPIIDRAIQLYHSTASQGQKAANNIRQNFNQFLTGGFLEQTGNDAYKAYTVADPFGGKTYSGSNELQNIVAKYKSSGKGTADAARDLNAYANTFQQMFNSAVGRDPTAAEYDQFFGNVVQNDTPWTKPLDQTQLRQETSGLLDQFYRGEAQKTAEQKAQDAANAAVAPGSAFDTWAQGYRGSINDVEKSLQDYQSKLFEKLRPQLLTSLKAQGLLDTGGLNEAFAGAAKDLGDQSQNYLSNARMGIEQDINTQKYGLMAAPGQFKLSNAFNTIPQLTQSGQTALQNVYGNMMNQNMFNQQAALQRDLANQQYQNQPSLLSQYGGMILGGAAGGFGQGIGRRLA